MPHGYHGRHRRRRALIIALAVVLGVALAFIGSSMSQSFRLDDFTWSLGQFH
jgi:hypothetical protein